MEEFKNLLLQNKSDALYIDKKEIKQRIKPTKKEFYKKERQDILDKINNIIGINSNNNYIYLYDIENDNKKKESILALSDDVKKYFKMGNWAFYKDVECQNNHVLLCKSIYKDMDYQIISKPMDIQRDNKKIRTTRYTICKIKNDF